MAEFDSDQPRADKDSDESIQPESFSFEWNMSSSSLISLVSSGSLDYYSCEEVLEDMPTSGQQMSELAPSSSSLCLVDCCVQIDEHALNRPHGYAHMMRKDSRHGILWHLRRRGTNSKD